MLSDPLKWSLGIFLGCFALISCESRPKLPTEIPLTVREDSSTAVARARALEESVPVRVAEGFKISLWASDSLAPDPVAMSIDKFGHVYLTRTNRQKHSEFDIRGHRDWMTPSIALQTVEDRREFLHRVFAPERSMENIWLEDLNRDSIHDWHDLAVEKEEVWRLEDTDKDGIADISKRILNDFNDEVTDVAGALLVRDQDVFVGVGPDMWRLTDTNGDEVLDTKTSIANGFAVHIGFSGHGMSGAIEGPDGKIYWGIGDIGAHIVLKDSTVHHYPNQGVIVRANADGSDFEVFAAGLRNTHEFTFDAYGNMISSDNDGDHRGESERLVHIVEGHDAGWRANWQYGKYTDTRNNKYNVWMDERLYVPRWDGQAAYIIPPITNYHNGPTGMVYNPGTALGKAWLNKFFLVEFVGNPGNSHIWSFGLRPKGASFELDGEVDVLSGILPTGIRFGPDGALYIADWINGWNTKNYGRVWRLDVADGRADLEAERRETERLMTLDYPRGTSKSLGQLLSYPDMRIRQRAQFELASRGNKGYTEFKNALEAGRDRFARIHSLWGIGQMARNMDHRGEYLMQWLDDGDTEIVAQAAKVLGDIRFSRAAPKLVPLLASESPRVRFFAAQALGRMAYPDAVAPLLRMIAENADNDVYLRHAGVLALSRIGKTEPIVALADNPDRSLRIAAVLVLRRLGDPGVQRFLNDREEYIVTEAARAINDDWSIPDALPALSEVMADSRFTAEPLLRRSINAALRTGSTEALGRLVDFASRDSASAVLRGEALSALGTWAVPSVLDRVDGRYRGPVTRSAKPVKERLTPLIPVFLDDTRPEILVAVSKTLAELKINEYNDRLHGLMLGNPAPEVRSSMLTALGGLGYANLNMAVREAMRDRDPGVRATALGLIPRLEVDKAGLAAIMEPIFRTGSIEEQQAALKVLGELPLGKSEEMLNLMIFRAKSKRINPAVLLDLQEAVEATASKPMLAKMDELKASGQTIEAYSETLEGGDWRKGRDVFNNNAAAQCVRCHSVGAAGGTVGPALDNIGNTLDREGLLAALITPTTRLAPGYGSVTLTLHDGQVVTGILEKEDPKRLVLRTTNAEPLEILVARIAERKNMMSAMPGMGNVLTKREIRDLIEYLADLKKD